MTPQTLFTSKDISALDRKTRLKLINAISGVKPANLIGSISNKGQTNLAIFSSVFHLGSDPALLGMIVRPIEEVPRHTYQNIIETGYYTINHIDPSFIENAHYTSAKFAEDVSEFERCGLEHEYLEPFPAPFVKESSFKMGMKLVQEIEIPQNKTRMIIGEVKLLSIPDDAWTAGDIDLEKTGGIGISGLNTYYELTRKAHFPYARPHEVPAFNNEHV